MPTLILFNHDGKPEFILEHSNAALLRDCHRKLMELPHFRFASWKPSVREAAILLHPEDEISDFDCDVPVIMEKF